MSDEAILRDPAEPIRVEPLPRTGAVYWLRQPRLFERQRYDQAVRAAGGRVWTQFDLVRELGAGLRELMTADEDAAERDRWLAVIDGYIAGAREVIERGQRGELDALDEAARGEALRALLPPDELARLAELLEPHLPRYRAMLADNAVYRGIAGIVAARMFLTGWEGGDLPPFRKTVFGVPDELLERVPAAHLAAIADRTADLMAVSAERGKGFASRSGGPSPSPTTSSSPSASSDPESATDATSSGLSSTGILPA